MNYFATKLELIFINFEEFCKRLKIMTGEIIVLWVIVFYRKWQLNVVPYHKGGGGICGQHNRESTTELRKLVFDTSTSQWPVALKWNIWHIEMSVFSPELSIILSTFLVARNRLFIWPSITWTLNWDKAINRRKNKNVSKQRGFELPNMSFCRFCSFWNRWKSSTYRMS